jgi:hypothetical protein
MNDDPQGGGDDHDDDGYKKVNAPSKRARSWWPSEGSLASNGNNTSCLTAISA